MKDFADAVAQREIIMKKGGKAKKPMCCAGKKLYGGNIAKKPKK